MAGRLTRARRWALEPLHDRTTWAGGLVLVVGAVPALVVLVAVAVGLVTGAALTPVGLGVPLLVASLAGARAAADLDRRFFAAALGMRAELDVDDGVSAGGWRDRARTLVTDPRTWRSAAWLAVRSVTGLLAVLGLLVTTVVAVALLAVPFVDGYLAFGSAWRSSAGWSSAWALPVAVGLLVGVAHGLRLLTTAHQRLAETLLGHDPAQQLGALQRAIDRADGRERLARELHDGLGHALTLVVVQAEAATTALNEDLDAARVHLAEVTTAARQALGDLDRALDRLHGGRPAREPAIDDIPDLVRAARAAGLAVELTDHEDGAASTPVSIPAPVPPSVGASTPVDALVSEAAYRVVQEALTNALRHSGSGPVSVLLDRSEGGLRVTVRSEGTGPVRRREALAGSGRGLAGLRDRVDATGGTIVAGPGSGEFVVEAAWPRP